MLQRKRSDLSNYYKVRYEIGHWKKRIIEKSENILWKTSFTDDIKYSKRMLDQLSGIHKNNRCFVVGNGPSINEMDLNLMKDDVVFASNAFFLKFDEMSFVPKYYTVEDRLVAEDNKNAIESMTGITKFYPYDLRGYLSLDSESCYVPMQRAYMSSDSPNFPLFSFDVCEDIYWGGTVLYMSIQIAAHMGFSEIYLIGVDLTYTIPNTIVQEGAVLTSTEDDPNHFNPSYFGKGKRWHLPETERMQTAFCKAERELDRRGVALVNATMGGNLNAIPRVEFTKLF